MSGINKVILIGNLGQDPDVRYTSDQRPIVTISVATSETWNDKSSGQKQEKTEWHRVVFFGKIAEIAEKYLTKGSKVYIEGKLQTRKWQDNTGNDRYTTEVVVSMGGVMQMLSAKDAHQPSQQTPQSSQQPSRQQPPQQEEPAFDDDIPF